MNALTRRGDTNPSIPYHIDRCICQHLGIQHRRYRYAYDWAIFIGLRLDAGMSLDGILDSCKVNGLWPMVAIVAFLNEHYVVTNGR